MFYLQLLLGVVVMVAIAAAPAAMRHRRTAATERAGWGDGRFATRAQPYLQDGETVLQTAISVLVATAKGDRLRMPHAGHARLGSAIGEQLLRAGAVRGGPGSTAALMPQARGGMLLVLTDRRLLMLRNPGSSAQLIWEIPRDELSGVTSGPRTGLMSRFRLHFADGSSAAVLTPNPSTAGLLQRHLAPAA